LKNETTTTGGRADGRQRLPRQLTVWRRVALAVLSPVFAFFLRTFWAGLHYDVRGDDEFRRLVANKQPVVFAFWHEGLLVLCGYLARLLAGGYRVTFLISPSVDGEFGVQILARFGSTAVRGSARRSGAAALRGLNKAIRDDGQSPCVTLDGSKGPRRYCKPGAIMVARMAGVPIVPLGFAAQKAWRLRSWDRHLIPRPFSKVAITVGDPYTVPRQMDADAVEEWRSDLEQRVNNLMAAAESSVLTERQAEKATD
jgi:lysophospholipid acyltransferase (LPLAT)-like uncharacterized protein